MIEMSRHARLVFIYNGSDTCNVNGNGYSNVRINVPSMLTTMFMAMIMAICIFDMSL